MQQLVNRRRMMGSKEHDYSKDYFTIVALEDGVISFVVPSSTRKNLPYTFNSISYSTDNGNTWITTTGILDPNATDWINIGINVNAGDKILWKGDAESICSAKDGCFFASYGLSDTEENYENYGYCSFIVEGNIMSLLNGDNFIGQVMTCEWCFNSLFSNWYEETAIDVVNAENLILPNNTTKGCYNCMFYQCTSLLSAPKLPATTLSEECYGYMFFECLSLITSPELPSISTERKCYEHMFNGCTNLVSAPQQLPATTLATYCYRRMFINCEKLVVAPILPAENLVQYCYDSMFRNCSMLNYVNCLATSSVTNATMNWVAGVSSTGIFVKHPNATFWITDSTRGIPPGWTVVNADV